MWSWLENEFLDYAFVQEDGSGKPLPYEDWGYVAQFSKYLSQGVYLSQSRSVSDECLLKTVNDAYGDKCFPTHALSSTKFGPPTCGANVEGECVESNFTGFTADSDKVFTAVLSYTRPRAELKDTLGQLRKHHWIDKNTAWLDIKYYLLNLQLGTYTKVVLEFEFSRGGRVVPTYTADSVIVNPYAGISMGWAILDALWIAFQIYTAVSEGRELRQAGWKEYSKGCSGTWNLLDWAQIVVTLVVVGIWFTLVGYLVNVRNLAENGTVEMAHFFVYTIEVIERYTLWYTVLSVVNLFILVIRFFKGFSAQPRLRVVVDTIVDAAVDLAHWVVIFISLLVTLVMIALFLFGHRVLAFSDASSAFFQLFRGWIAVNSIPMKEFTDGEPSFAIVWYLLYIPFLIFVLNKVVLAIVLGAFIKARNNSKDSLTLWEQMRDVFVQVNAKCKRLIKLGDVIDLLGNPESTLAREERVNYDRILDSYRKQQDLTEAQDAYASKFILSLMQDFFKYYDKTREQDSSVRQTNAYSRAMELDDDFTDLRERLDLLESHADEVLATLQEKFKFNRGWY